MPRFPRPTFNIRTALSGPVTSPAREKELRLVKKIEISPEIQSLLETPTWSVSSLLPPSSRRSRGRDSTTRTGKTSSESQAPSRDEDTPGAKEITREKLHHLLRLSALPLPSSPGEESQMLQDLRDQVHFVKEIQKVDTTGIEPLVAIRDETSEHRQERTITRSTLAEFLALEERKGKNGTIRRRRDTYQVTSFTPDSQPWKEDPLAWSKVEDPWELGEGEESRKMGRFFFVKRQAPELEHDGTGKGEGGQSVKGKEVD
ncbi:aspartyl/glutamyl-tRNA(Asn/Gln) amidotransferase, C subunit [Cladophialophora bantiana CBS 173.52]|uniref:Aspartyl/glutamyl-tRNA(Asn/Gln) amidotransferase, C subunit n=1 Tax=Cladophialophora bantiana (strain ATCC 10958 / CBS 173.52 / CDC B-1940 / NIH 8579) TaxID=1442370 RepID=A0A0D2FMX4_CLAB1|nr:aspartyl/glutamyl-tRNA(Asn/Gln) amidotransferase, C subunit [Cladophialophora bantiana CBS 173.52]KIW88037.1 aspartyl/glutamyl-tRNA(Asn/Gln) amidotransferase, C subunit [Cladophialophora bantiana CBS 173.52]